MLNPSSSLFALITAALASPATLAYDFPDQELLAELFAGRWVPLPYVYNALKTMAGEGVHARIWRIEEVRVVHFILSPKPWEDEGARDGEGMGLERLWWEVEAERGEWERARGIAVVGE